MHKVKVPFILALTILIAACSVLGVPVADTFNKRVVVANGLIETSADTVSTLVESGRISKEEALTYVNRCKEAARGVDLSRELLANNPREAEARLSFAIQALTVLRTELEARGK